MTVLLSEGLLERLGEDLTKEIVKEDTVNWIIELQTKEITGKLLSCEWNCHGKIETITLCIAKNDVICLFEENFVRGLRFTASQSQKASCVLANYTEMNSGYAFTVECNDDFIKLKIIA